ncbi:MAG: cytochrome c3 family protein [Thermodesulfobacteriota bacterium]
MYCHLSERPGPSDLLASGTELCLRCHPDRTGGREHPVGSFPTFTGPTRLPLGDGRIICTTCHNPHASTPGMLRLPPQELCPACHTE